MRCRHRDGSPGRVDPRRRRRHDRFAARRRPRPRAEPVDARPRGRGLRRVRRHRGGDRQRGFLRPRAGGALRQLPAHVVPRRRAPVRRSLRRRHRRPERERRHRLSHAGAAHDDPRGRRALGRRAARPRGPRSCRPVLRVARAHSGRVPPRDVRPSGQPPDADLAARLPLGRQRARACRTRTCSHCRIAWSWGSARPAPC